MRVSLRVMLIVAAIYHLMNVAVGVLPPEWMGQELPGSPPAYLIATKWFWGVASLPLAIIAWLVRNAEPSTTRNAIVLAMTVFFIVQAPVSAYAWVVDQTQPAHLLFAAIEGLIAVGFILAGRSNMSKAAS